jgi:FkbM family methyltransferase
MNKEKRDNIKARVLQRYELYKLQNSRIRRVLRDPLRTIPFFALAYIAYKHPFKVTYKTFWGDKMRFYLPEGNTIYYYGFFEANLTNFFLNILNEDDIFFYVGAHVGYYTVLGSALVGSNGQVHSFEPTPRTHETLLTNASSKKNITVNNLGALDKESEIEFVDYGPKYSIFNTFNARNNTEVSFLGSPKVFQVKTITLDTYCKEKAVSPDLIKIDAEGVEFLILQGFIDTLRNKKPVVTIEVGGDEEWKENCSKSIHLLEDLGYIAYEITIEGFLKKHEQQESYSYDNLAFIHPEKSEKYKNYIK